MRVCFVITKSEVGGAQKWVKEQIDILTQQGTECFLCTNQNGWLTTNSKSSKNLTDIRIEKRMSLGLLLKLVRFVKDENIDLLIGSSANGGIYSRLAAFFSGKKSIYVTHGWSSVYNGGRLAFLFNWIENLLSTISAKILCVSANDYRIALEVIKIKEKKLVTIPNKIFGVIPAELGKRSNLPKNQDKIKILFLGRLAPPKSPIPLVQAIQNRSSYQLDIVGSGPDEHTIKQYIQDKGIQNVELKGEIKDFNSFNDYDLFCLISKSEGLPLSAVEALSCGLPILISNVGGCPEVINNNGYLTNNNPEDILKGIKLIEDNIGEFSENSLKLFAEKFDLSKNFREYINLYEDA